MTIFASGDPGEKDLSTGMHRTCSARETIERIMHRKHDFGITRLANVTGLDRIGVPVALAIRPNARSVAVSQGKGLTLDHAKASALMESVEIWHAETFQGPLHYGGQAEMTRATLNTARLPPMPDGALPDTLRLFWAEGIDLMNHTPLLVPFEMLHADYTHPTHPGHGWVPSSTNGLASGNHPLEAICHGICEVIERDALSVWHHAWTDGEPMRRVPLDSIDNLACQSVLEKFAATELDCTVWDITTDLGVASFMAVIRERGETVGHLGLGSGTHLDRGVALRRALTEAAQTRLNYISGSRDDLMPHEFELAGMSAKVEAFGAMQDAPSVEWRFNDTPSMLNGTLRGDLDDLLAALNRVGIEEVAVVDLTRAGIDIPVMRVVIPGLEAPHDEATYVPGPRALAGAIR